MNSCRYATLLLPLALAVRSLPANGEPAKIDLTALNPQTLANCREYVHRSPDDAAAYRCFAFVARRHRLTEDAIAELAEIVSRQPKNAHALLALATLESAGGDARAVTHYLAAAESYELSRDYDQGIKALTTLFFIHARQGETARASDALTRASSMAQASGLQPLQLRVRYHEGLAAWYARDYGLAYSIYSEVEEQVFPGGVKPDTYLQTMVQNGLGQVAWALGRRRESYGRFQRAAEIEHGTNDLVDEAFYRQNVAILAVELGEHDEADPVEVQGRLQEALELAVRAPNPSAEAKVRLLMAAQTGRALQERTNDATRALELARKLQLVDTIGAALRRLADLATQPQNHDYRHAESLLDEAQQLAERSSNRRELYQVQLGRAVLCERRGDRVCAIDELRKAVEIAEQLRALQPEAATQSHAFAQYSPAYSRLVALLAASDSEAGIAAAFDVSERWRAGALLAALAAARVERPAAESTPDLLEREQLLQQLAAVQRSLVNGDLIESERTQRLVELSRLERDERVLRDRLARNDPHFRERTAPAISSLAEIQTALAPRQVLLSYLFPEPTDDGVSLPGMAFVVSAHQAVLVELPPRSAIARQISLYLGVLTGRDPSEPAASAGMYRAIIEPLAEHVPSDTEQLVIIPDPPLHRLPIATLRPDAREMPLVSRYSLSFASSAATWKLQSKSGGVAREFLSFADPDFEHAAARDSGERGAVFGSGITLGHLRAARRESRAVARALVNGHQYAGGAASEHRLKTTDLSSVGLLHLAAHAIVDEVEPDRSAVLLTPGESHEDGLLQPREIARLKLPGAVVVLSACQTAAGEAVAGEGVLGLSRSFFEAGASTVVASLWPLRDEEAADLTAALSAGLARGDSVAAALAAAQRSALEHDQPAASWAGFVVLGRGDLVPFPGGVPHSWWPMVLRTVLLAAALLVAVRVVWRVMRRGN